MNTRRKIPAKKSLHPARLSAWLGVALALVLLARPADATILWSHPDATLAHENGDSVDLLHGAVQRDDLDSDTLYFKFRVDPLSDVSTEEYYAGLQLFFGDEKHLAIGNSPKAWAYSAFYTAETFPTNKTPGDFDLSSSRPELFSDADVQPYELPRRGNARTLVFKVQFVRGGDDRVTVWLSPNLNLGATEENQPRALVTKFKANAAFDQIRVRHMGGGGGWIFSDLAVATSFSDFIVTRFWQTWWFASLAVVALLAGVGVGVRRFEKQKFWRQLQRADQERALERERARIAQDLHDDLGSSLTRISLLSDLIRADRADAAQLEIHTEKISQSAAQTVRALEEIVWAVRPSGDSLQSLVEYLAHFADEMFADGSTRCRLDLPHDLPARPLPPELRHNIFLIVKEALTNAVKHGAPTEVRVHAKVTGDVLEMLVRDDGHGFDPAAPNEALRNGLGNMKRRADAMAGKFSVISAPGQGTSVSLVVTLPRA
ncbi:MAG: hypothetical protein RLZZ350_2147 [Verrucomicrobiota bacterium]